MPGVCVRLLQKLLRSRGVRWVVATLFAGQLLPIIYPFTYLYLTGPRFLYLDLRFYTPPFPPF